MRIAVCEDNITDAETICGYIKKYCDTNCFVNDIEVYESGEALLREFAPNRFDMVLMDIYLNGMSGVEAAKKIREQDENCALLFVTCSMDHALDGYAVQAMSYIVKPLSYDKLENSLSLFQREFLKSSRYIEVNDLRIPLNKILYAEVYSRSILLHLETDVIKTGMTLEYLCGQLGGNPFLRCHRCYIVNMNHVKEMLDRDFVMKNNDRVPFSSKKKKEIRLELAKHATDNYFEE